LKLATIAEERDCAEAQGEANGGDRKSEHWQVLMVAGVQGQNWERARGLWMKQKISGDGRYIQVVYLLRKVTRKGRKEENKALGSFTSNDGGAGKCGQNAGDVMERERSSEARDDD